MKVDSSNIETYFQQYKDNIFAIGFNYFKNEIDADDVVQETFLKLFKSNKDFESKDHLKHWLIRVAVNECKRVTLSSWVKRKVSIDEYAESLSFEIPEESELFSAVMELPKKYRQVIHLYYYEDFSIREIADIMNISETAVSTQLLRGRKKLRGKISEVWKDD